MIETASKVVLSNNSHSSKKLPDHNINKLAIIKIGNLASILNRKDH
jgi:hypothetical protein